MNLILMLADELSVTERILGYFFDEGHPLHETITLLILILIIIITLIKYRNEFSILIQPVRFIYIKIKNIFNKHSLNEHNYVNRPNKIFVPNKQVLSLLAKKIIKEPRICVLGLAGIGKTTIVRQLCYSNKLNHFEYKYEIDFESVNPPIIEKPVTTEESFNNAKNILFTKFKIDERESNLESFLKNTFKKHSLLFIDNYEQITADKSLDSRIRSELIQPFINHNFHIVITSRDVVTDFESFILDELGNFERKSLDNINKISKRKLLIEYPAIKLFFKIHNKCKKEKKDKNRDLYNFEDIKIIIELCHKVSNLPLGIMILATRSVELSVKEILENLKESLRSSLPVSFANVSDRQSNLYNAFLWSFNLLSQEEQKFFAHLTFFKNSTLLTNIPKWLNHNSQEETKNFIEKLYSQSLINRIVDPSQGKYRYELYFITREMFSEKMKEENISWEVEYCEAICREHYKRLSQIESLIFEPQTEIINYQEIAIEVRLDIENIIWFVDWCTTYNKNLAIDILIKTENILSEMGPYIFLNELFNPLLNSCETGINRATLLLAKARVVQNSNNRNESNMYIDEAISILENHKPLNTLLGKAYSIGTYLYGELGKYQKRIDIIDKVLSFSEEEKKAISNLDYALIILEKGRHHEKCGEIKLAIESFEKSIDSLENYNVQLGKALNYAALFFWRTGEAKKAEAYLFEAIYRYNGLGENRWILGFKTNIGLLFADMGKIKEGLKYTNEASKSLEKEGPYSWYLVNLLSKGRLICRISNSEKEYNEANGLLLESYKNFESILWFESMTLSTVELAELNYKHHKYDLALEWSDKAINYCKAHGMSKSMRFFRSLTINALSNYKLKKYGDVDAPGEQAQTLLNSVEGNKWLNYKVCNDRYLELNEIQNMNDFKDKDMIPYPWTNFLSNINEFYLFGYGSLINEYSFSQDMKNSSGLIPVIGYKIKRILNYDTDETVRKRPLYQDTDRGDKYSAAFNVEFTNNSNDKVNGVLRKIERKDFKSFIERERGYSLVKIKCESFSNTNKIEYEAYTLCAPKYYNGRQLINNNLLPNVPYYRTCKQGASDISEEFLKVWLETSYLGDGRNVVDWEKEDGII